jgi:hypothetical protein
VQQLSSCPTRLFGYGRRNSASALEDVRSDRPARSSAPVDYDKARHPLTIADAVELFAQLGTPRSKRSVQRFCEQGHLDCVRIKGPRGDQFFINRESVMRYAEELRQIEAIARSATKRAMTRRNTLQRASARQMRDTPVEAAAPMPQREPDDADAVRRLKDENLNLRIDNRAKERSSPSSIGGSTRTATSSSARCRT